MNDLNEVQADDSSSDSGNISNDKKILHNLNLKRGVIKGKITRFSKYLSKIVDINKSVYEIKKRLNDIEPALGEFEQIQEAIESIYNSDDNEIVREEFERDYYLVIAEAEKIMSGIPATVNSPGNNASTSHQNINNPILASPTISAASIPNLAQFSSAGGGQIPHNSVSSSISNNVQLPAIPLPIFSGNIREWPKFLSAFTAFVNRNPSLDTFQKFYYLRGSLRDDALKVIEEMGQQDENYESALDLLKARFDRKHLIKKSHIDALFNIELVQKENSKALRTFLDEMNIHLRALSNLGEAVETWDILLLRLLSPKLDSRTKREWEAVSSKMTDPKLRDFQEFLENRCQFLENLETSIDKTQSKPSKFVNKNSQQKNATSLVTTFSTKCVFCKGEHTIYKCKKFIKLNINERFDEVKKLKLCTNCLRLGHFSSACKSFSCKFCKKRHNALLHHNKQSDEALSSNGDSSSQKRSAQSNSDSSENDENLNVALCSYKSEPNILLTTAVINIENREGNWIQCRALLDNGSQSNFMTKELFNNLKLKKEEIDIPVKGIGITLSQISGRVHTRIKSNYNAYQKKLPFLIINKITDNIPLTYFNVDSLMPDVKLADPDFCYPGKIDLLLGAGIFWELLCVGQINLGSNKPILQKSKLGWLVSGQLTWPIQEDTYCHLSVNSGGSNSELNSQLERFWMIEEFELNRSLSFEEEECERIFEETTVRNMEGRFVVNLPMRVEQIELGASREVAVKRFNSMENRFKYNSELKRQYVDFMREYEQLCHMTEITPGENDNEVVTYYLPHHGVLKEASLTTKLRVVFDASSKTINGVSLNDILLTGPTIQDDLFSILVRFRKHAYVVIADVAKMYRQILINENQRDLQRIFWRESSEERLKEYRLNTLTYGTSPASFISTRCLHELAYQNSEKYPDASKIILRDFYVDDLITGDDSLDNIIKLKGEIIEVLGGGCFQLRKWLSNDPRILFPQDNLAGKDLVQYIISDSPCVKTLGLLWNSEEDNFKVAFGVSKCRSVTKRSILSSIAQIFDPLGLVGPITLRGKILLQKLWSIKSDWDESVPTDIFTEWRAIEDQLVCLKELSIPRHISQVDAVSIQIHGFCDASELAYGACLYLRTQNRQNLVKTHLICAKSKVAPLKRLTIPRLELSGALLLAKLSYKISKALNLNSPIFYWCDSTIVLHWLSADSNKWKIFVGNRVAEIQRLTERSQWQHICTKDNPADIISRGCLPKELISFPLWWNGPEWLSLDFEYWPSSEMLVTPDQETLEERIEPRITLIATQDDHLFKKFSSLSKLVRVTAYARRFAENSLAKLKNIDKKSGYLSSSELKIALDCLIKLAQRSYFGDDCTRLASGEPVSKNSKLSALKPFIDNLGIIRVGGRISNSLVSSDQKFPIILPDKHPLTKLIILHCHLKLFHAGPQLTLSHMRLTYWPLKAKGLVRKIIHDCITCFRVNPRTSNPMMGDLPTLRVVPARPFLNCGIDYAGPFLIKDGKLRNKKLVKCYLGIFVCFSTKAVHLELVGDLTTESFLNALKRFVSRRGICSNIFSDNATNFRGADNELREIFKLLNNISKTENISRFLTDNNINWHFIPPSSPHMGGLWEAAVKSAKYHLKRIIGNITCTYEELYTIIVQIEAILNSRPLFPMSDDPSDLIPLTPSHFLIGEILTATPQVDVRNIPSNRLSLYHRLQQGVQHFWKRWSNEYLSTLNSRTKWRFPNPQPIKVGALIVLKNETTPPMVWPMGRVVEIHPGKDNVVRVISVRTKGGIVKRAVSKVCVLPIEINEHLPELI